MFAVAPMVQSGAACICHPPASLAKMLYVLRSWLVGYRVPVKPLRFELWGAHEDLLPTETRPQPRRDP